MDIPTYEREYSALGYRAVAGVDEVGRGPLAGPVVCAAVILPIEEELCIAGIDDSKKLSPKRRSELAALIRSRAVAYSVAEVDERTIDEINILQATRLCMKRAVEALRVPPDLVLIDGPLKLDLSAEQRAIVKGDALVYSIGAASILAKVHRDELMRQYAEQFPEYGFEHNVGYGTQKHLDAIKEYGICKIHRRTFVKKYWDGRERL